MKSEKNYMLKAVVGIFCLSGMISCNDSVYSAIDNAVYVSEANTEVLQKVMVDDAGGKATMSVRANKIAEKDIVAHVGEDAGLLEDYNNRVGTSYVVLPSEYYELSNTTATIVAGASSAISLDLNIKPLPEELIASGKKYAIPLSILDLESDNPVLNSARGVIYALDQVIVTYAPKLSRVNKVNYTFKEHPMWDQWTVEMMVNMSNLGSGANGNFNNQCIFNAGKGPDVTSNTSIFVRFGDAMIPGNKLQIKLLGNVVYESNVVFSINEWYHLAFVYDGAKFRVYVDGNLDKETDAAYGPFQFNKDNIFSINGASGYFKCNMKIREVRMWSKAIDQTQVRENMFTVDPDSEGLAAYWKMNEGQGSILHDATGHGNDGSITDTKGVISNNFTWIENVRSDQKADAR